MNRTLRCAVLLSGTGRTLENLVAVRARGELPVDIVAVASDRDGVRGLAVAEGAQIPHRVFSRKAFADATARDAAMFAWLHDAAPDVVVLAGYLALLHLDATALPVLNIHPSLLPKFGGKGFYGHRVHEAVLAAGERRSGATVHLVDAEFDRGPIVAQAEVAVEPDDDADRLAARVFAAECDLYPRVLRALARGDLRFEDGQVVGSA